MNNGFRFWVGIFLFGMFGFGMLYGQRQDQSDMSQTGYISILSPTLAEVIQDEVVSFSWTPFSQNPSDNITYRIYMSSNPAFAPQSAAYSFQVINQTKGLIAFSELQAKGLKDKIYWRVFVLDETTSGSFKAKSPLSYFSKAGAVKATSSAVKVALTEALAEQGVTTQKNWAITKITIDGVQVPFEKYIELMRSHQNIEALEELELE